MDAGVAPERDDNMEHANDRAPQREVLIIHAHRCSWMAPDSDTINDCNDGQLLRARVGIARRHTYVRENDKESTVE
jgi:hypothetical protein